MEMRRITASQTRRNKDVVYLIKRKLVSLTKGKYGYNSKDFGLILGILSEGERNV